MLPKSLIFFADVGIGRGYMLANEIQAFGSGQFVVMKNERSFVRKARPQDAIYRAQRGYFLAGVSRPELWYSRRGT
jgi:hypothetical protein